MKLTIFTPVYNREETLLRLYESLLRQNNKEEFQWIIVDDGSTDKSGELIKKFQDEKILNIEYKYVKNGGKMRAINEGVKLAQGDLFFIVDSDDYVTDNCVAIILEYAKTLPKTMGGMIFRKQDIETLQIAGGKYPKFMMDSSPLEMVYRLGVTGDKAEVFRTELLRENPFEVFEGEKFIPEATIWIKIGERYKMRYIDEVVYYFQYLESGYTKNFHNLMRRNPRGFRKYYSEMLGYSIPLKNKIKFLIRYLQACYYTIFTTKEDRR